MVMRKCILILFVTVCTHAVPADRGNNVQQSVVPIKEIQATNNNELETAASSYSHQYADWGGNYPGGYGFSVTGFGTIDEKYANSPGYRRLNGYEENPLKNSIYSGVNDIASYETPGYKGYGLNGLSSGGYGAGKYGTSGYGTNGYGTSGYGNNGYGNNGYGNNGYGNNGYGNNGYGNNGYGNNGYGNNGYGNNGYGNNGYGNGYSTTGYGGSRYIPNGLSSVQKEYDHTYGGNGGYGGFGGNGGLNSYYGYNNPNHIGAGHLGYGYHKGNIYNNGVTPSLVAGYRGYTRR